jgi:hypothetical protein
MSAAFKSFLIRFTSRKFLLAVVGMVLVILLPEHSNDIIKLVALFVGFEGAADVAQRVTGRPMSTMTVENTVSHNADDSVVDTSRIISGKPEDTPIFNEELGQ